MFNFFEIFSGEVPVIRIVDVGAAEHETDPYARLSELGMCEVIGFEPNPQSCAQRNANAQPGHRYLPLAVGDGRRRRFYECKNPLTSSLYPPNTALLETLARTRLETVGEYEIQTHRLDDLPEIEDIDYLKLDVQGAEVDVILGAQRLLKDTLLVNTEVGFIPLYVDQALFGDVDVALRQAGFWLNKFANLRKDCVRPFFSEDVSVPFGQFLYAEAAIYVRSFMTFDRLSPEKLLKMAAILHDVHELWDLAALALQHYDARSGTRLLHDYLVRVNEN